jgi:hypothetical protein
VSEHDDITAWKDRAASTEKRDWDLPFARQEGQGRAHLDHAGASAALGEPGHEPGDGAATPLEHPHGEPAEESERRDWDIP